MSMKIKEIKYNETIEFIDQPTTSKKQLTIDLKNFLRLKDITKKSVLGMDIYRYSKYPSLEQTLIPVLFKRLYDETANFCLTKNKYFFQIYEPSSFIESFISTGDGGFQIFETPIHSLLFAIGFATNVRAYNSGNLFQNLNKLIGDINLRYVMTFDDIYKFEDNYYGPSIINNSRILSKDSLNRFLLDEATYNWFLTRIAGIETLRVATLDDLVEIEEFSNYTEQNMNLDNENIVIGRKSTTIQSCEIQKIGTIEAKQEKLSIYNLHLQVYLVLGKLFKDLKFIISLGNLNPEGIVS